MNKIKLSGLIMGGMTTAVWFYFNFVSSLKLSAEDDLTTIITGFIATLFIIPFILAWQWEKVAGWLYILLVIILGGVYCYIMPFISDKNYYWWIWLIRLLLMFVFPLTAGLLLIKSKSVNKKQL